MDKKGIGLVGLILLLGIFGIGMGGLPTLSYHFSVQENQPTTAVVQSTAISVSTDDDGDKSYYPSVTYEYTVDGKTYRNDNRNPGRSRRLKQSRSSAADIIRRYSPGDEVTVYYRPGDPSHAYLHNDGPPMMSLGLGTGYGVLALVAGLYLIRVGFKRRKQRNLMQDTPTEQAESLSMGPSEITGTAVARESGPLTAPFTDDDCVIAKFEIEEYDEDADDDGGSWKTIEEDVWHVPFYVDDGTGAVLVRPHDETTYDVDPDDWLTIEVDSSERGPPAVQTFIENTDVDYPHDGGGTDGDRRYKQNLIRTDEPVYVFGTVQPREDATGRTNVDNIVVKKVPEGDPQMEPMFLISDDEETDLVDRRRWALWRLPVGIVFAVVGVGMLVGMLGPLIGIELPILI